MTAFDKLSDEQKDDIQKMKKVTGEAKKLRKLRTELRDLTSDKPSAASAWNYYFSETAKNAGVGSIQPKAKECAEVWMKMSPAARKPYEQMAEKAKKEQQTWKMKVAKDGREHKISAIKRKIAEMKNL